jgi:hypothetical protein
VFLTCSPAHFVQNAEARSEFDRPFLCVAGEVRRVVVQFEVERLPNGLERLASVGEGHPDLTSRKCSITNTIVLPDGSTAVTDRRWPRVVHA